MHDSRKLYKSLPKTTFGFGLKKCEESVKNENVINLIKNFDCLNSRNQLTALPREVCRLPLQTLLVAHNRLASLPEELGRMTSLAELDAGCNEIVSLPPRIGDLPRLRFLDLRSNFLVHLPIGKFTKI